MTGQVLNQTYEIAPVDSVHLHERNYNAGDVGAIHESIETTGFYGTIVVQKSTRKILAGNHRWKAAVAAGITEVPVVVIDVDDEAALRILVGDNRIARLATVDDAALAEILAELAQGSGLEGTGFDQDGLDELLETLADEPTGAAAGSAADPDDTWSTIHLRVPTAVVEVWAAARDRAESVFDGEPHAQEPVRNGLALEAILADYLAG